MRFRIHGRPDDGGRLCIAGKRRGITARADQRVADGNDSRFFYAGDDIAYFSFAKGCPWRFLRHKDADLKRVEIRVRGGEAERIAFCETPAEHPCVDDDAAMV